MDLELDDEAFVRAPPASVYRWLTDFSTYPAWWPGFRIIAAAVGGSVEPGVSLLTLELRARPLRRPLRIAARPYRFRPGKGVFLDLDGDLAGDAEWWLEEGWGGTVVHHLIRADTPRRRPRTVAAAYRASVRRATWGLKDAVQSEVRSLIGLPP